MAVYRRHEPEKTLLYRLVQEHWRTFAAFAQDRDPSGRGLPKYVRNAFEGFLDCGILQHGFVTPQYVQQLPHAAAGEDHAAPPSA